METKNLFKNLRHWLSGMLCLVMLLGCTTSAWAADCRFYEGTIYFKSGKGDYTMSKDNNNEYSVSFYCAKSDTEFWFKINTNNKWYSSNGYSYHKDWTGNPGGDLCTDGGDDHIKPNQTTSSGWLKINVSLYLEYSGKSKIKQITQTAVSSISPSISISGSAPRYVGTAYTLTGSATGGSGSYKYEFFVDGTSLGSASATNTKSWTPSSAGDHKIKVKVTDNNCSGLNATSSETTVTITNPCTSPSISAHPSTTAANYCQGATATALSVTASGTNPTYQWYSYTNSGCSSGETQISGATSNTYKPSTATVGDLWYKCKVTACGTTVASDASGKITVTPNASITSVSLDKYTATVGESVQASKVIAATGGGTGSWKSNNTSVATINATSGAITTLTAGEVTFTYSISGGCGSASKTTSTLTVSEPACTQPTLEKPSRNASQTNYMTFNCKATAMGDCTIESWGLKAYTNSACTGDPVATVVATTALSTTRQSLQLTGLTANTKYFVKLYVVLDGGITLPSEATQWQTKVALEAPSVADIVCDGATLSAGSKTGGTCTATLTEARFRYSTIESDITEKKGQTAVTSVTSVGSPFSATLTGLTPNTKYYYRTEITFTAAGSGLEMQTNGSTYNFTTAAASCTAGTVPTFANVVLGQSGTAQNATFTYCGYDNFTYELSGTNAGDFQLGSGTAASGTITLPVTFKPTSGIGNKSATIVVKSNSTQVATMNITATAKCITPTKANYSVSGNTHTYDGLPKTAVITPNTGTYGTFTAGTATYGGQASQTNVGNYTIHYNVPVGGNYCAANFDFDEKLTINKATFPNITGLPTETVILCSGLTEQLNPVCAGATFTYSSNDTGVATVNGSGLITAVAAGNATITVTATNPNYNDKSATVTVQVKTTPSVTITASPASVGPWEISDITVTPSAGTATVELWKGGSEVSPTDADVVFEGSGTAYKLKAANKTESSITYTVKATTTSEGCTSAEATKDIPVTKAATEVCQ